MEAVQNFSTYDHRMRLIHACAANKRTQEVLLASLTKAVYSSKVDLYTICALKQVSLYFRSDRRG